MSIKRPIIFIRFYSIEDNDKENLHLMKQSMNLKSRCFHWPLSNFFFFSFFSCYHSEHFFFRFVVVPAVSIIFSLSLLAHKSFSFKENYDQILSPVGIIALRAAFSFRWLVFRLHAFRFNVLFLEKLFQHFPNCSQ